MRLKGVHHEDHEETGYETTNHTNCTNDSTTETFQMIFVSFG